MSTEVQLQVLKPWPCIKPRWRLPAHPGETQLPQGSCSSPLAPNPHPNRAVIAIEHRRSPGLHLALVPAYPTPALPPKKAVAASTPWWKTQPMLTTDSTLPQKTLGIGILQSDAPTQGHNLNIGISN